MKTLKFAVARYGRSITSIIFPAIILAGPVCVIVGILIPFIGGRLPGLIAAALDFA